MALTVQSKAEVVAKYQRVPGDTGSPEVQVALLSARIEDLAGHFQVHKKDTHTRRGLLQMVSRRRSLLAYLKRVNYPRYLKLLQELNLRG
jgi:small subunit ribosomal protein S15